jgi:hypothetical protein
MKNYFWIIFFVIFSCSENPESYIEHLEGYWEITEVVFPDGNKKVYKYNETIDYISVNDSLRGFRKKLKPGINDTYYTSEDAEGLVAKLENDSLNLYYKTPYNTWKETVLEATPERLRIVNSYDVIYVYKRYTMLKLDIEE